MKKTDVSEKDKKIFADLDELIVELQNAPLPVIKTIIIVARAILKQKY